MRSATAQLEKRRLFHKSVCFPLVPTGYSFGATGGRRCPYAAFDGTLFDPVSRFRLEAHSEKKQIIFVRGTQMLTVYSFQAVSDAWRLLPGSTEALCGCFQPSPKL